jgi:hypothetical protein
MVLTTIPATPSVIEPLTQVFGDTWPIHLTDKEDTFSQAPYQIALRGIPSSVLASSPLRPVLEHVLRFGKITLALNGGAVEIFETPEPGVFGGARSTGDQQYNEARTADYRDEKTIIRNPRLPDSVQPLTVTGGTASTSDADVDRKRKVIGPVPGTSIVFNSGGN